MTIQYSIHNGCELNFNIRNYNAINRWKNESHQNIILN